MFGSGREGLGLLLNFNDCHTSMIVLHSRLWCMQKWQRLFQTICVRHNNTQEQNKVNLLENTIVLQEEEVRTQITNNMYMDHGADVSLPSQHSFSSSKETVTTPIRSPVKILNYNGRTILPTRQ